MRSLLRGLERHGGKADAVLANYCFTAWPVFLARLKAEKFYYVQAYEPEYFADVRGFRGVALRALAASSYLLPMTRIVNSPLYLRFKHLRSREWIPCGIDLEVMKPGNSPGIPGWGDRRIVIGTIGRRESHKGTLDVLAAIDLLLERGRNVELRVAYGNLPEGMRLNERLKVVIPQNDVELADYYRSVDILVTAVRVQLGAVHYPVLEAMACGKPVVTTGHLPASRERDNAWFARVNDPADISKAIESVFAEPSVADLKVRRALADVVPFAWDRVTGEMMRTLQKSLGLRDGSKGSRPGHSPTS
jgi:glycosyltransferase involved in cell wall biosynthesis